MKKEKKIELLQTQIDLIDGIKQKERFSQDYEKWKRYTEVVIEKIFGNNTRHIKDFTRIKYSLSFYSSGTPDYEFQEAFLKGMETARSVLTSMQDELREFGDLEEETSINDNSLVKVKKICNRFHLVATKLRGRYNGRDTLEIKDEYDVQDLLHAILKIEFDDIRPEEYCPSYAGGASRADFLLKKEGIIIEVKKTRKGLADKEIGEQLSVDIQRYEKHPDCKYLICFVYDPEGWIRNPSGIEDDLTKTNNKMQIITIITPKGI